LFAACAQPRSHIYAGRLYLDGYDCLDRTIVLDVVDGPDPGSACDPTCLALPGEAGVLVYVSTMCAPFPPAADTSGADPRCPLALAAYARDATCGGDAGSSNPVDARAE
jgi:hypothetical protein